MHGGSGNIHVWSLIFLDHCPGVTYVDTELYEFDVQVAVHRDKFL